MTPGKVLLFLYLMWHGQAVIGDSELVTSVFNLCTPLCNFFNLKKEECQLLEIIINTWCHQNYFLSCVVLLIWTYLVTDDADLAMFNRAWPSSILGHFWLHNCLCFRVFGKTRPQNVILGVGEYLERCCVFHLSIVAVWNPGSHYIFLTEESGVEKHGESNYRRCLCQPSQCISVSDGLLLAQSCGRKSPRGNFNSWVLGKKKTAEHSLCVLIFNCF